MPKATLLYREALSSTSLTAIVAKSQKQKPPFFEYNLSFNSTQLDLTLLQKPAQFAKPVSLDEGFESDIDSISLVSSDESFTSSTCLVDDHVLKHRENDSANGSSSSESDTEIGASSKRKNLETYQLSDVVCYTDVNFPKVLVFVIKSEVLVFSFDNLEVLQNFYTSFSTLKAVTNQRTYGRNINTKFNLLQRTDNNGVTHIEISRQPDSNLQLPDSNEHSSIISINTPDVVDKPPLVGSSLQPKQFISRLPLNNKQLNSQTQQTNHSTNQQTNLTVDTNTRQIHYNSQLRNNLSVNQQLIDSDNRIVKQTFDNQKNVDKQKDSNNDSIKVLNTKLDKQIHKQIINNVIDLGSPKYYKRSANQSSLDDSKIVLQSELKSSRSEFYPQSSVNSYTLKPRSNSQNLELEPKIPSNTLKKVWKSAEDLLDGPKRPERRRKLKGRAPPPPIDQKQQNIMKGQFIRVAVDPKTTDIKSIPIESLKPSFQTFSSNIQTFTPNWNNLRNPPSPLILTTVSDSFGKHASRQNGKGLDAKKSETWTSSVPRLLRKPRSKSETRNITPMAYRYIDTTSNKQTPYTSSSQTISNRLFGLSQKLKEFSNNVVSTNNKNFNFYDGSNENRRNSLGEMTYKLGSTESNLKSVIKKQDEKKSKPGLEKKVTFSAYATVQVV